MLVFPPRTRASNPPLAVRTTIPLTPLTRDFLWSSNWSNTIICNWQCARKKVSSSPAPLDYLCSYASPLYPRSIVNFTNLAPYRRSGRRLIVSFAFYLVAACLPGDVPVVRWARGRPTGPRNNEESKEALKLVSTLQGPTISGPKSTCPNLAPTR